MNAVYQYLAFCLLMLLLTLDTTHMRSRALLVEHENCAKQARTRQEKCHAVVEMYLHAAKPVRARAMQHLRIHSPLLKQYERIWRFPCGIV